METSFFAMRCKEVINVVDGKSLGKISDLIFDLYSGQIYGLLVPASSSFFNIFRTGDEIFIPYQNICKIGEDVILVDIMETSTCSVNKKNRGNIVSMVQNKQNETNNTSVNNQANTYTNKENEVK